MKKILVISWFYPPINSSEGLVTYKLINNSQYTYDVFTQKGNTLWSYGNNMDFKNHENVHSVFAKSDTIDGWVEEAVEYFSAHASEYDIIMTRSMPQESHIAGRRIKEKFPHVKWIAGFGDPVDNNPYLHISCMSYGINSTKNLINRNFTLRQKLNPKRALKNLYWNLRNRRAIKERNTLKKIEFSTFKLADKIILNNESQKKFMLRGKEQFENKVLVIPHSFDETFYDKKIPKKHEKMRFVFVGHLDEIRNVNPLLKALAALKEELPDLAEKAEFFFYGDMGPTDKLTIIDHELFDMVKLKKPVSYTESLAIMQDADWLIHAYGNVKQVVDENIFFAAKIADYFGSGTPILAVSMQEGAIIHILRGSNSLVLSYSAEEIKNYLYLILEQGYTLVPNKDFIAAFESKRAAAEFDKCIPELLK